MSAKRKHGEAMLGGPWPSQEEAVDVATSFSHSPPNNALQVERTPASGYPRRRVAVAVSPSNSLLCETVLIPMAV